MSNESRTTEAAEMERGKTEAPGRLQPDQGRGTTRQAHITTERPHIQGRAAQRARLLAMLRRAPVSTLEARAVGIMSPASRIFELRQIGLEIITTTREDRVAIYHLIDPPRRPGHE